MRFDVDSGVKDSLQVSLGVDQHKRLLEIKANYESSSFLVNRFELLLIILGIVVLGAIVTPLVYFKPGGDNMVLKYLYILLRRVFFFGIYIAILMEGYFFGCLLTFYELYVAFHYGHANWFSLIFTIFVLLILIALPIGLVIHYSVFGRKFKEIEDGFFAQFYVGLNTKQRFINGYYMAIQLVRRGVMAASCIFLMEKSFSVRVSVFAFANLIAVVPLLMLRPYKDWKINLIEILNELSFYIVSMLILISGGEEYDWKENGIYWVSLISGVLV